MTRNYSFKIYNISVYVQSENETATPYYDLKFVLVSLKTCVLNAQYLMLLYFFIFIFLKQLLTRVYFIDQMKKQNLLQDSSVPLHTIATPS